MVSAVNLMEGCDARETFTRYEHMNIRSSDVSFHMAINPSETENMSDERLKEFVKEKGLENDLIQRMAEDPLLGITAEQMRTILEPARYVGRAPEQTEEFVTFVRETVLSKYQGKLGMKSELKV